MQIGTARLSNSSPSHTRCQRRCSRCGCCCCFCPVCPVAAPDNGSGHSRCCCCGSCCRISKRGALGERRLKRVNTWEWVGVDRQQVRQGRTCFS